MARLPVLQQRFQLQPRKIVEQDRQRPAAPDTPACPTRKTDEARRPAKTAFRQRYRQHIIQKPGTPAETTNGIQQFSTCYHAPALPLCTCAERAHRGVLVRADDEHHVLPLYHAWRCRLCTAHTAPARSRRRLLRLGVQPAAARRPVPSQADRPSCTRSEQKLRHAHVTRAGNRARTRRTPPGRARRGGGASVPSAVFVCERSTRLHHGVQSPCQTVRPAAAPSQSRRNRQKPMADGRQPAPGAQKKPSYASAISPHDAKIRLAAQCG